MQKCGQVVHLRTQPSVLDNWKACVQRIEPCYHSCSETSQETAVSRDAGLLSRNKRQRSDNWPRRLHAALHWLCDGWGTYLSQSQLRHRVLLSSPSGYLVGKQ